MTGTLTKRKIIIDTDPGIDDAMAIHLAFAHPGIEVMGLTTIFGNVQTRTATRNALALVEMAAAGVPVAHGAEHPLVHAASPPADFVHGVEGFGDVSVVGPDAAPDPRSAAAFIVDTINRNPGDVTVCAVGPLSNLALALQRDPGIAGRVRNVVVMGGAIDTPGNVSEWAEANIWGDPHAADAVFAAPWNVTLVGLDVTEQVRCYPADLATVADNAPSIGGFLNEASRFYFGFHRDRHGLDACFTHDPSAIVAVTNPELFTTSASALRVTEDGEHRGQIVRCTDAERRAVDVCLGVNEDGVREVFLSTLLNADVAMAVRQEEGKGVR